MVEIKDGFLKIEDECNLEFDGLELTGIEIINSECIAIRNCRLQS